MSALTDPKTETKRILTDARRFTRHLHRVTHRLYLRLPSGLRGIGAAGDAAWDAAGAAGDAAGAAEAKWQADRLLWYLRGGVS